VPRIDRARRQLEGTDEAGATRESKHKLLDAEMSRVGWFLVRIPAKLNTERDLERHGDPLPRVECVAAAETALNRRDSGSREPNPLGELLLGPPTPAARRPDLLANDRELSAIPSGSLASQFLALEFDHG
jgi:hypothetical protein